MALFTAFNPRIHISIGSGLTEKNSHGSLWTKPNGPSGNIMPVYFLINKPRVVRNGMTYQNWSTIKQQIAKMGIVASHIELTIDGNNFCYRTDNYQEIYAGKSSMSVVTRLGFA